MSPMRWQIEPPPLAPGAGAQWLIAALVALGPFSLTMYQPALPSIASSLNITTAQVQITLTVYLASFAIGQLIYGPMSDHFGRRRTLLLGLAIFVAGAIACALATSAAVLIAARVLQGLGACAGPALGRAMIRDLYGAKGSAKAMAWVSLTAAYFVGTLVANRLAVYAGVNRSIMLGSALLLIGAVLQMALALNLSLSIWSVLVPQMIWLMAMGIVMPNAMAGAVAPFPMMAGAAASLQGFAMMAAGALSSLVLSRFGAGVGSLGLMMCALAVAGTAVFAWATRQHSATPT